MQERMHQKDVVGQMRQVRYGLQERQKWQHRGRKDKECKPMITIMKTCMKMIVFMRV